MKYKLRQTVYMNGVAGRVLRRLWRTNMRDPNDTMHPCYEVQFTDGRRLILEENELSYS